MRFLAGFLCAVVCGAVVAQTSTSYDQSGHVLNEGGHPESGVALHSASYRVSLDSVGDGPVAPVLSSASYAMDVGFARSYPPPGEVHGLVALSDKVTLAWAAEASTGTYAVYRGLVASLPGGYGACLLSSVSVPSAAAPEVPPLGGSETFFYLVTASNRLHEEGTKGTASSGSPRSNPAPCP